MQERIQCIYELDLEPIKFKLVAGDGEPGWNIGKVDLVEVEYKRFLILNLKNRLTGRMKAIVPTKDVDKFWHTHILDTAKYSVDCEFCLGFFLHHFPYLGLRGADDAKALRDRFRESIEYYQVEFGEPLMMEGSHVSADCDGSECAPEQSCSGDPPPVIRPNERPVLARA